MSGEMSDLEVLFTAPQVHTVDELVNGRWVRFDITAEGVQERLEGP